jgi:hypothetical protein
MENDYYAVYYYEMEYISAFGLCSVHEQLNKISTKLKVEILT